MNRGNLVIAISEPSLLVRDDAFHRPTQQERDVAFRFGTKTYWNLTTSAAPENKISGTELIDVDIDVDVDQLSGQAGPGLNLASSQAQTGPEPTSGSRGSEHR